MRSGPITPVAFIMLAVTAMCDVAWASETFLCPDKTMVHVNAQNRAQMYEHPCVVAWFETNRGGKKPGTDSAAQLNPTPVVARAELFPSGSAVTGPADRASEAPRDAADPTRPRAPVQISRGGRRR